MARDTSCRLTVSFGFWSPMTEAGHVGFKMILVRSLIGRLAVFYAFSFPDHRGRFRLFSLLDFLLGPFRLRTPAGPVLEVFLSSPMDLSYFRRADFGKGIGSNLDTVVPRLIGLLQPGECFVDVGANIGWLTCLASARVGSSGRVIAIEPSAREFTRLLQGLALNGCFNTIPVHAAFGADHGVGVLEIAASHTGLNRLASPTVVTECPVEQARVLVPVWSGDQLLPTLIENRRVGLVKIDTEGAELMVLNGLQRFLAATRPRHVVVEITPRFLRAFGAEKSGIYRLMEQLGFRATVNSEEEQYDEVFVPA